MTHLFRHAVCLAAIAGLAAAGPAQRGVRTLTASGAANARLSPNGNAVAYRTTSNGTPALGVISTVPSSKPTILAVDKSLTEFLWAPDSAGLYYQIASTVYYVRSIGGTAKQITKISGVNPRMGALDSKDKFLVGTRSDSKGASSIFTVPTDSSANAVDILTDANNFYIEVALDPSGTKIGYTRQITGYPHSPIDIRVVGIDGKNDASLSGGGIPRTGVGFTLPSNLSWADNGTTLVFTAAETTTYTWGIARVTTTNSTIVSLTLPPRHCQRSSVSGDRTRVVYVETTFHGATVPGIMPAQGGARIPLEPESSWTIAGNPSIDKAGLKVAFAGFKSGSTSVQPEVQLIEMDREIVVKPRPALQASLTFELPLSFGESGTLFLSTGLSSNDPKKQFTLPNFTYAVALDPNVLLPLISGVGSGTPLSFSAAVPNLSALVGFTVYLQGLRVASRNPDAGDFTRYAELQFFAK